jgi:hypothetical protein
LTKKSLFTAIEIPQREIVNYTATGKAIGFALEQPLHVVAFA